MAEIQEPEFLLGILVAMWAIVADAMLNMTFFEGMGIPVVLATLSPSAFAAFFIGNYRLSISTFIGIAFMVIFLKRQSTSHRNLLLSKAETVLEADLNKELAKRDWLTGWTTE